MAEYTDEQIEEIKKQVRQETEKTLQSQITELTNGLEALKKTNQDIKQEKIDAIKKAEQEKIDALREKGDEAEAVRLELERRNREFEDTKTQLEQRDQLILGKDREVAQSEILSIFSRQDKGAKTIAASLVETEFGENGVARKFRDLDGNVVANNFDDWKAWANKDPDMANYIGGGKASGTDHSTINPSSSDSNTQDYSKMTPEQKLAYLDTVDVKRN